jgi:aryl-alcohol dehydrogenase-like predicted oxidoreductase
MADPASFAKGEFRTRIPRCHPENWPHNRARLQAFHDFAAARGMTPAALALAWLLDRGPQIIPIPGTRGASHLHAWLMAPETDLDDHDRDEIDRLLPIGWACGDRYDDAQAGVSERYS